MRGRLKVASGRRSTTRLAVIAAAAALFIGAMPEPAKASEYVSGVSWTVTPTQATICANGTTDAAFYWAEAIVINQEVGGAGFVEGPGSFGTRCRVFYPRYASQRSYFRHYHVCNNYGACTREIYI